MTQKNDPVWICIPVAFHVNDIEHHNPAERQTLSIPKATGLSC